ncbi:hypothetical protein NAI80_09660, partial [Francisella tularensis subsp. holarctica]|nr:hypothetical protein [Francisella tularensis subsp. holarctica]
MPPSGFGYHIGDHNHNTPMEVGYRGYLRKPIINGDDGSGSRSVCIVGGGKGKLKSIICPTPAHGGTRIVVSENAWDAL